MTLVLAATRKYSQATRRLDSMVLGNIYFSQVHHRERTFCKRSTCCPLTAVLSTERTSTPAVKEAASMSIIGTGVVAIDINKQEQSATASGTHTQVASRPSEAGLTRLRGAHVTSFGHVPRGDSREGSPGQQSSAAIGEEAAGIGLTGTSLRQIMLE